MPRETETSLTGLQQTTLILLRTLIGWHFLYEGYFKLGAPAWTGKGPGTEFSAAGFIKGSTGILGDLARWTADAGMLPIINKLVIFGLIAAGLSLILGLVTKAGCVGAMLLLSLFYFTAIPTTGLPQPNAEGSYLFVNKTLIEGVAVFVLFSFDTGRIAGLDRFWYERRARVSATPLVKA